MLNKLYSKINPAIIELLEQLPLEKQSPNKKLKQWWKDNGLQWASQLRTLMVKDHNIGHDWQFSHQQLKLLKQYYDGNKFLVACLNSSFPQKCDRLLAMPYKSPAVRDLWDGEYLRPVSPVSHSLGASALVLPKHPSLVRTV
jgi:hypothetical protein